MPHIQRPTDAGQFKTAFEDAQKNNASLAAPEAEATKVEEPEPVEPKADEPTPDEPKVDEPAAESKEEDKAE